MTTSTKLPFTIQGREAWLWDSGKRGLYRYSIRAYEYMPVGAMQDDYLPFFCEEAGGWGEYLTFCANKRDILRLAKRFSDTPQSLKTRQKLLVAYGWEGVE